MKPLKFKGIVIRSADVGDYNKMLTVLSGERGKLSIWARGVKSPRNKEGAACSLLCFSEFVVNCRGEVCTLSQANIIESFYHLRDSIEKLSCAIYLADLSGEVSEEAADAEDVLKLLLNSLYYLEKDLTKPKQLRAMFELRLLAAAGFMPHLNDCVLCGNDEGLSFISLEHGGAVCEKCSISPKLEIRPDELSAMQNYLNLSLKAALTYHCSDETVENILKLNEAFIAAYIGKLPKTLDYLKSLGG
jgi:DNA repair protein RecO (recombination protein O)